MNLNLTILNDPLISNRNVNELIKDNSLDKVFLNKDKKILNLYGALIKTEDIKFKQKRTFLKKCPYMVGVNNKISKLFKELSLKYVKNDFLLLRELIGNYYLAPKIGKVTFDNWFLYNYFPLPVVRILTNIIDKDLFPKLISDCLITDISRSNQIKFPIKLGQFLQPFNFYLSGITMGDGTINRERWKIVDGDEREEKVAFSKDFLYTIKTNIEKNYAIRLTDITLLTNKNAYELIVPNKWFVRFLNFFFGIPLNKKNNVILPLICNLTNDPLKYKSYILRGLYDTDGSVDYRITFTNNSRLLIRDVRYFLKENKINFVIGKISRDRNKPTYMVRIPALEIVKFASKIGLAHPRKQKELIKRLSIPSKDKVLVGIKKENLIKRYFDLAKLPKLFVVNGGKIFKKCREFGNLSIKETAKLLDMSKNTIIIYEKSPRKKIPLSHFLILINKSGFSLVTFYSWLEKEDVVLTTAWKEVRLPFKLSAELLEVAKYVRPVKNAGKVRLIKTLNKGRINKDKFNEIVNKFKKIFNIDVRSYPKESYAFSKCLELFFNKFFEYKSVREIMVEKNLSKVKKEWDIVFS